MNKSCFQSSKDNKGEPGSAFSDEALIRSWLSGSEEHGKLLFRRHERMVASLAWRMVRDPEEVKEIVQNTFVKVFNSLEKFKGDSPLKTWIYSIARNTCMDYLRQKKKEPISLDSGDDALGSPGVPEPSADPETSDPSCLFERKEVRKYVAEAMKQLPPDHRIAITLWMNGLSQEEIGKSMGINARTAGTRVFYAKKKLREILDPLLKGRQK